MTKPNSRWINEITLQVQFYDLDPMGVVWHGHYVRYLEMARGALLDKIDYNYLQMKASGYAWPIIDLQVRYIGALTFGQQIKIHAAIVEWENRLKIDYLIMDAASGRRLTRASTIQIAINMTNQEMCFVSPTILFEKLGILSC